MQHNTHCVARGIKQGNYYKHEEKEKIMGNYDVKFAAYEKCMQAHNDFGLTGQAVGDQLGRYCEGLQYDQNKAANKKFGKEFGRALAEERRAALSASEQAALSNALSGGSNITAPIVAEAPVSTMPDAIKVSEKIKVGDKHKGYKLYLKDKEVNIYRVDRKTYNAARKR